MATELGKAYVQIIPSAKGISGMIQKEMGGEVASAGVSAGESLGSKMMGAVSGVIAAAGIGKAIGASINEGAALQQSLGGVETLFKDSADKVKGFANEAYKTTGLSANAYMENVTGFSASLLQSLGGDTDKAAETANMAMIDMSDNANKMGTSMESIQLAYQGFAKQNYTMLDNLKLGYGGTKQEMQRLLADAEKLTGVKYDINNLSDVYSAIHTIQENLDITGTTAREAATTFTGSFESMKSAAQNVLGKLSLGEDIQPALQALMETTSTFLFGNLIPMIGNILKQIPILILGGIKGVFSGIFGEGLGSIMGSIVTALGSAFLAFKAFSTVSGLLSGIPAVLTTIKTAVTGL
ncbi:PblA, partial [Streptococcus pneumoniae]|nr:PblA [Streptococcus pneumoniae]